MAAEPGGSDTLMGTCAAFCPCHLRPFWPMGKQTPLAEKGPLCLRLGWQLCLQVGSHCEPLWATDTGSSRGRVGAAFTCGDRVLPTVSWRGRCLLWVPCVPESKHGCAQGLSPLNPGHSCLAVLGLGNLENPTRPRIISGFPTLNALVSLLFRLSHWRISWCHQNNSKSSLFNHV